MIGSTNFKGWAQNFSINWNDSSRRQTRVKEERKEEGRSVPPPSSSSLSLSTLDPPEHGIIHNAQLPHHSANQHVSFDEVSNNKQDATNEKCAPINNYNSITSSVNKKIFPSPTPTYYRPFSHDPQVRHILSQHPHLPCVSIWFIHLTSLS